MNQFMAQKYATYAGEQQGVGRDGIDVVFLPYRDQHSTFPLDVTRQDGFVSMISGKCLQYGVTGTGIYFSPVREPHGKRFSSDFLI